MTISWANIRQMHLQAFSANGQIDIAGKHRLSNLHSVSRWFMKLYYSLRPHYWIRLLRVSTCKKVSWSVNLHRCTKDDTVWITSCPVKRNQVKMILVFQLKHPKLCLRVGNREDYLLVCPCSKLGAGVLACVPHSGRIN